MWIDFGILHNSARSIRHRLPMLAAGAAMISIMASLSSCDRAMVRTLIDKIGQRNKAKPSVYHEFEGYSPGARRSKAKEDFDRYQYYIAPEKGEFHNVEPEIHFRQDYEPISAEPQVQFDESQYWRDHPLTLEGDPAPPQEPVE